MPKFIMNNSQYWRTRLITYNGKKNVTKIRNSQRIFFGRYDKTRAVASATKQLRGEVHKSEVLLIGSTLLLVKVENIYMNTIKMQKTKQWKQGSAIKQLLETLFLDKKIWTCFTIDGICMNTICALSLANHLRDVALIQRQLLSRGIQSLAWNEGKTW